MKTKPSSKSVLASPKRIYLFDVCNTLFDSNTTFDFIHFHLKKNKSYFRIWSYNLIVKKWSPLFWFLVATNKITRLDLHRRLVVFMLRNTTRVELVNTAELFYKEVLTELRIKKVQDLLHQVKSETLNEVLLVSGSIDPVVQVIADHLGVKYLSSHLAYKHGKVAGFLSKDLIGRKESFVKNYLQNNHVTVITDNYSDRRLLELADERLVVLKNSKSKLAWGDLDATFIMSWES